MTLFASDTEQKGSAAATGQVEETERLNNNPPGKMQIEPEHPIIGCRVQNHYPNTVR
jgi:hypothetical protein